MATLSLTQSQTLTALRSFLLTILPAPIEVIQGQTNRTPEPKTADFVVMTPILRQRLETNIDDSADVAFTASIAGTVMTVTAVELGLLGAGQQLFGPNVAAGSKIIAQLTGPTGGTGTYTVAPSQTAASAIVASGATTLLQPTKVTVQLDVHGPASADNAQIITTLLRDAYAVDQFAASGFDVTPLYASDPRQAPFENEQQQVENRWTIDAVLQVNPVVSVPQQYADALVVGIIDVDVEYPPGE